MILSLRSKIWACVEMVSYPAVYRVSGDRNPSCSPNPLLVNQYKLTGILFPSIKANTDGRQVDVMHSAVDDPVKSFGAACAMMSSKTSKVGTKQDFDAGMEKRCLIGLISR